MSDISANAGRSSEPLSLLPGRRIAVLDLGSNSFHLQIVVVSAGGELLVVERIKDKVQLLAGFSDGALAVDSIARAHHSLARLGQRLGSIEPPWIFAIGTSALRQADNVELVLDRARSLLGVEVEVVSGEEEARLIYAGVAHHLPASEERRGVIDIGGGSTEFALGRGYELLESDSIEVGCVGMTDAFFREPDLIAARFSEARDQAARRFRRVDWQIEPGLTVYGTSGTVESIQSVLLANGFSRTCITREGLDLLIAAICEGRTLVDMGMPGLQPERVDIFPAGVAIVGALFDVFEFDELAYLPVSLQNGVLVDMLKLPHEADVRDSAVRSLMARFQVDPAHAERVLATAMRLQDGLAQQWQIDTEELRRLLGWAALLCELGLSIGVRGYHRHGAYIIGNTELRGFDRDQKRALALLVRSHRRRLPSLAFVDLPVAEAQRLRYLSVVLRLAVILNRSHADEHVPVGVDWSSDVPRLTLPDGWLAAHALSASELKIEQTVLSEVGIEIELSATH